MAFASMELGNSNFKNGFKTTHRKGKPMGVEMAFVTENVESDFKKALEMGALENEPLTEKPWNQTVGYVLDNNGFLIEICSPIKG